MSLLAKSATILMLLIAATGCCEDDCSTDPVQRQDCVDEFGASAATQCRPGFSFGGCFENGGFCGDHKCVDCEERGSDAGPSNFAAEALMSCAPDAGT